MNHLDVLKVQLRLVQRDTRMIGKEHGVRVRRDKFSGVWAYFPDGSKQKYHGWMHIFNDFVKRYGRSG